MQPLIKQNGFLASYSDGVGMDTFSIGPADGDTYMLFNNGDNVTKEVNRARSEVPYGVGSILDDSLGDIAISIKVSEKKSRR